MIFGVGVDLVSVARFQALLARRGPALARRILHPGEVGAHAQCVAPARDLAKRWAVKEAYAKALRTGLSGIHARDIALQRDAASGAPAVVLSEHGARFAHARGAGESHLSISDEGDQVVAIVVLERACAQG